MTFKQSTITLLLVVGLGLAGCEQKKATDEKVDETIPETRVIQQLNELAIALIKSVPSDPSDPNAIRGDTVDVARTLALC